MSEAPPSGPNIRPFLFFDEGRPKRTWMPALEAVNDRFAQYCRTALLQYLQPPVEVAPQFAIEVMKHGELIDQLQTPSYLTVVALKPLPGTLLIAIEPDLVGVIVESRFGGSGRIPVLAVPDREFAAIELQTMSRIVERLVGQLASAWKPIAAVLPEIARRETKPAFAGFANSTDFVIVNNFVVTVANGSGRLTVAIPYRLLQPLHERLSSADESRPVIRDARWAEELRNTVGFAAMELNVELAAIEMTVREFLALRPGAVFEIARPDAVTVRASGQPLFRGRWGRHGRKIAVRIDHRQPEPSSGSSEGELIAEGDQNDAG